MDIKLEMMTSGRVRIENVSKVNYPNTIKFLETNRKHMDSVSFGDRGPNGYSHSIKSDRVVKFVEHAAKFGLIAQY